MRISIITFRVFSCLKQHCFRWFAKLQLSKRVVLVVSFSTDVVFSERQRDEKFRLSMCLGVRAYVCISSLNEYGQDKQTIRLAPFYTILYIVSKNKFIEQRLSIYADPIDDSHENFSNSPGGLAIYDINSRQIVRVQVALRGHI